MTKYVCPCGKDPREDMTPTKYDCGCECGHTWRKYCQEHMAKILKEYNPPCPDCGEPLSPGGELDPRWMICIAEKDEWSPYGKRKWYKKEIK